MTVMSSSAESTAPASHPVETLDRHNTYCRYANEWELPPKETKVWELPKQDSIALGPANWRSATSLASARFLLIGAFLTTNDLLLDGASSFL